jgi:Cu/Ag efflux pump CusA
MVLASFGVTFNLLILAGLVMALAIVVDDAVIGVDNVRRRLRENREDGTILAAAAEMRGPMLTATLITAVSVVPVVLVGAVNGSFLKPLGYTYALTVLVSTVIAMTVAPALAMVLLSKTSLKHRESPLARWLGRGYTTLLTRLLAVRLSWSFAAAGVAVLVLASGLAGWLMIGSKPVTPVLQDRSLLIRWDGMPGTSLPEMDRITAAASRELRSVPGVRNVGAVMGRAVASDQVSNVNTGELWVTLDSTADYASTSAAVQGVVSGYPGLAHELQTYQNQQLQKTDTRSGKPVLVRVYGYDFNVLRSKADEVAHVMSQVDGVSNAKVQAQSQEPTVEVEVAADKAASHGIKPGEVRRAAATLMSGITAGVLYEQQKVFDVVVRSTPETRANLTSLSDLLIDKPDGGQVRLGDVATVQIRPNPVSISHNGASRSIDVVADAMGRDVGSVTRDLEHRLQQISFPREHHLEVLSDAVQKQGAHQRTLLYGLAAVIALFFLLQASFSSWRLASILLPVLPAALAGGVLMALRPDGTMSVVALMGLLGVLAIATRTGILMIKSFQRLEAEGEALGPDLVLRGAQERFVPIVTTVLATGLALTPLVIYGNRAGLEMANPMAAIILGGLISTALVVLFGLPALFLRFGARHTKHAEQNSGQPAARGA